MKPYKSLVFSFLSFFFLNMGYSQNEKIEAYIQKCSENARNTDSLFFYSNLLLAFTDKKAKTEGYFAKGYAFRNNMQLDSALYYFNKAAENVAVDNLEQQSKIARMSAVTATQAANYDEALRHTKKLKTLSAQKEDSLEYANALGTEGIIHKTKGNLNTAIEKFSATAKIQKANNYPQLANTYTNIAVSYVQLNQDSLALQWFQKAYVAAELQKDTMQIERTVNNLGNFYKNQKQTDSSLFYFNKLLKNESGLTTDKKGLLFQNLADLYTITGELKKSRYYYSRADSLIQKGSNPTRKLELLNVLLRIEKQQQNHKKALAIADTLLILAEKNNLYNQLLPIYFEKANLLKEKGNFESALIALDNYHRIKDSLSKFRDMETIQRVVSEYELAEKEIELQASLVNKGVPTKSIVTISILTIGIVSLLIFFYNWFHASPKKNMTNLAENNQTKKQFTLKSGRIIKCNNLVFVKSDGHYLEYHLLDTELRILERNRLKNRLEELQECNFIQTHRSYIVNADKIKAVYATIVQLENQMEIPLSRNFKQKLKEEKHRLFS